MQTKLRAEDIQEMLEKQKVQLYKDFPTSTLNNTCESMLTISREINRTIKEVNKRNYIVTGLLCILSVLIFSSITYTWKKLNITFTEINVSDFVQMFDASFSFLILLGSGALFLISYQSKARKKKLTRAISKLTGLAHVIEAHQLSKDPHSHPFQDDEQLIKYLGHCSDLLALTSKIGFLYVQAFDDPETQAVESGLENLISGISRKVWQKIMIIQK